MQRGRRDWPATTLARVAHMAFAVLTSGTSPAETFHNEDGFPPEGTIRPAVSDAPTCNVLGEIHRARVRATEGQPRPVEAIRRPRTIKPGYGFGPEPSSRPPPHTRGVGNPQLYRALQRRTIMRTTRASSSSASKSSTHTNSLGGSLRGICRFAITHCRVDSSASADSARSMETRNSSGHRASPFFRNRRSARSGHS